MTLRRKRIKVLVVDDSSMFRQLLTNVLSTDEDIDVVGAAAGAAEARAMMSLHRPDVITLDLEMPGENGLDLLKDYMAKTPVGTLVISAHTQRGASMTIKALEAGAVDVIDKSLLSLGDRSETGNVCNVVRRVRAASMARVAKSGATVAASPAPIFKGVADDWVVAIGSSTGGVQALTVLLPVFPEDCPATVIVQHMPEGFTAAFAKRLNTLCKCEVKEAEDGDQLRSGLVLIALGGDRHMSVEKKRSGLYVRLTEGEHVCFSRPSVDVLFKSLAETCGPSLSAAILTGMGRDGAEGLLNIRRAGGRTFTQDEPTSEVYGMPARAWENGASEAQVPLSNISKTLLGSVGTKPAPHSTRTGGIALSQS